MSDFMLEIYIRLIVVVYIYIYIFVELSMKVRVVRRSTMIVTVWLGYLMLKVQ